MGHRCALSPRPRRGRGHGRKLRPLGSRGPRGAHSFLQDKGRHAPPTGRPVLTGDTQAAAKADGEDAGAVFLLKGSAEKVALTSDSAEEK